MIKRFVLGFVLVCMLICLGSSSFYDKYYDEAYTIAVSMSIDQKIGQTVQVDFYAMISGRETKVDKALKYSLGSILIGGNGCPDAHGNLIDFSDMKEEEEVKAYSTCTIDQWKALGAKFSDYRINVTANNGKKYSIGPLLATDAVKNDQHIAGNILFPHNIGTSCSHNPQNFYNMGRWTASNIKRYGFNYAFAPTVAVSHNPQWGRFYETMGQEPDFIRQYAKSYTEGLQGTEATGLTGVLGSVKHFIGDGATYYGADEGSAQIGSYKTFIERNIQGYNGSIDAGIGSVMCSYSAVNYVPMAAGNYLQPLLRRKLKFDGFIISDYNEIVKIKEQAMPTSYQIMDKNESIAHLFAAGVDMFMIPSESEMAQYIGYTKMNLNNRTVSVQRLNDAVARILAVKLALGMIEREDAVDGDGEKKKEENVKEVETEILAEKKEAAKENEANTSSFTQHHHSATTEYEDSLTAVHESLVLLKNTANLIPVNPSQLEYIVLVGERIININNLIINELFQDYDNIGVQNGGWTGRWQGFEGNLFWTANGNKNKESANASSILDGLNRLSLNNEFSILFPNYTSHTEQIRVSSERKSYLSKLETLRAKMTPANTLIIGVLAETVYAEMCGDVNIPYCQNSSMGGGCSYFPNPYLPPLQKHTLKLHYDSFSSDVIKTIRKENSEIPLLTVMFAGRPMLVDEVLEESTAFIHAFLPGTSGGQGVVDAVVGDYVIRAGGESDRTNTLSFDWPKSDDDLKAFPYYPASGETPQYADPLFKVGYGLSSKKEANKMEQPELMDEEADEEG